MEPGLISDLLRRAERETHPPRSAADDVSFASAIRRRAARRRHARAGAVASAAVVAAVLVGTFAARTPSRSEIASAPTVPTIIQPTVDPDAARSELARLRGEADRAQALADRLGRAEAASRRVAAWERSRAAAPLDPVERVERRREQAALILVHQADRLDRELGRRTEAAAAYRDAAERFPQTHWAAVARERLRAMQS